LAAALWLPFQLSPRPGVWVVRSLGRLMAEENEQQRKALERRVPAAVDRRLDLTYDPRDPDGRFDLFRPIEFEGELPTVIWVHGGAFIGGTKDDLRPYLALLASRGFIAIGIEYTTAMEAHYPTPVLQLGSALHHLRGRAAADY